MSLACRERAFRCGWLLVHHGSDGVDIRIQGERVPAVIVVGGFLLLRLIVLAGTLKLPEGVTNLYGIDVQIPEGWPTRAGGNGGDRAWPNPLVSS